MGFIEQQPNATLTPEFPIDPVTEPLYKSRRVRPQYEV
jgi:hypothetical protein